MTQIEQIKAEIERLKNETCIGISEFDKGVENGRMEVLDVLLKFADSLSMEEPSEELVMKTYLQAAYMPGLNEGYKLCKEQPKLDYNKFEKLFDDFCERHKGHHITSHDACMWFWELGLKAQEGQVMKHTIEGCYIHRNRYTKTNVLNGLNLTDKVFQNFKNGDKLQLIVIKEGGEVWGA